jgi:hypothetical protein
MPTVLPTVSKADHLSEFVEQSSLGGVEALTATPIVGSVATVGVKLSVERTIARAFAYKFVHITVLKNFFPLLIEQQQLPKRSFSLNFVRLNDKASSIKQLLPFNSSDNLQITFSACKD